MIDKLKKIKVLISEVEDQLYFENMLSYCYDYIDITIRELEKLL